MRATLRLLLLVPSLTLPWMTACKQREPDSAAKSDDATYEAGHAGYDSLNLKPNQERGRRIWYEAAGDNGRFHTYVVAQRHGLPIAWHRVLGTPTRAERWTKWGLVADPDCVPGDDSTYGFDVCKGDRDDDGSVAPKGLGYQGLLGFVGKPGYKDPGCFLSGQFKAEDCPLGLGTSTGVLGYRKFPNPRFDAARWPGWDHYDQEDGSVEPPFLIGTACGSCHITFNPLHPPKDPSHPAWANITGLVGNQYQHMAEVGTSGLSPHSLEWQAATHSRPGTVDTSSQSNDLIFNPGTVNALINVDKRPPGFPVPDKSDALRSFDKSVLNDDGKPEVRRTFNILKGGEDDVGGAGAIMRVYVNEGLCSEVCWMNHLLDNRSIAGRNSRQTPFDAAQCRRDCPNYRALESHYTEVFDFFVTRAGRPMDLKDALYPEVPAEQRYPKLVATLGADKIKKGRHVYAKNCASCHSSQRPPQGQATEAFFEDLASAGDQGDGDPFLKADENGVRIDWLGNEERLPVTKIGTIRCRALHSNHMRGHIWDEFSSETYKNSPTPPGIPELAGQEGGGRGYMRNVSLLSIWNQAPFMHNNAVGPELCNHVHPNPGPCVERDAVKLDDGRSVPITDVDARLKIFDDSMKDLLNPERRGKKITVLDEDIIFPLGLQANLDPKAALSGVPFLSQLAVMTELWGSSDVAKALKGLNLVIPKGTPVALLGSMDYRRLANGLIAEVKTAPAAERPKRLVALFNALFKDPQKLLAKLKSGPAGADPNVYSGYSNCTDVIEDKGHEFGTALADDEKDALIAFMKTL